MKHHATTQDLPGWNCPQWVSQIPHQKGAWGWVRLPTDSAVLVSDDHGCLWVSGKTRPDPNQLPNSFLAYWVDPGAVEPFEVDEPCLGIYMPGSRNKAYQQIQRRAGQLCGGEPDWWIPVNEVADTPPHLM